METKWPEPFLAVGLMASACGAHAIRTTSTCANSGRSNDSAMLEAVKTEIEGKWVRFEGYMMSDSVHRNQSESTAPGNASNWRATPWEVHPVTAYAVVPAP